VFILFALAAAEHLSAAPPAVSTATVNSADVYVRSGPGKNYYPTDKLLKGETVEVYREDPGGWLAIRPPRGSFSWVRARHLNLLSDGLAKASSDRVVCHVGSTFSDMRDVVQVRLNRDEQVEVLETAAGGQWYRISPPSGEFRWISSKFVDRQEPTDLGLQATEAPNLLSVNESNLSEPHRQQEPSKTLTEWTARSASASPIQLTAAEKADDSPSTQPAAKTQAPAAVGTLQQQLEDIELDLSIMVSEELSVWTFTSLRQRAEKALDQSQTALERGRVRVILGKIERFENIKQRHDGIASLKEETDRRNSLLGDKAGRPGAVDASRYDGIGRLTWIGARKGAPHYALVDGQGAVTTLVSPAPGVNLKPFMDKQVGVNGPRSLIPEAGKQHVAVQRVTLIESLRR
jgi:SH3-like domain-containing protein